MHVLRSIIRIAVSVHFFNACAENDGNDDSINRNGFTEDYTDKIFGRNSRDADGCSQQTGSRNENSPKHIFRTRSCRKLPRGSENGESNGSCDTNVCPIIRRNMMKYKSEVFPVNELVFIAGSYQKDEKSDRNGR